MKDKRPLAPDDLYRLRLVSDPQISPDGAHVAFVVCRLDQEKDDYLSNIYLADADGAVTQFTAGDKDSAPRWSPDGRWLAFLSERQEKAQIHLMPAQGGESVAITNCKLGAGVPIWSPDSDAIAFAGMVSTTPEQEEDEKKDKKAPTRLIERSSYKTDRIGFLWNRRRHLFLIDVESRTTRQLTDGDFFDDAPAWSPDGHHLAFESNREPRWDVSDAADIYLIPRSGGEARRITEGGAFHHPVFSPDGSRVAFIGHQDARDTYGPPRLYSMNRSGGELRDELGDWGGGLGNQTLSDVAGSADGLGLTWREDGIFFLATVRGEVNIQRASSGTVSASTQGRHAVTDFSVVGDATIAFTCADSTHLPDVYLLVEGETRQLTHQNDDFLAELYLAAPQRFGFTGARGEESEGWLLAPRDHQSGKHPLIVYIHGGPAMAHGETFHFEYQYLAGQGFGVFYPNIHGSASYGRDYQTCIRSDWGNLDYQDVLAGTEAAATRDWVDPERMGIAGGSYGGYMTNWVMGHSDRFKAGVTERCCSNLISFVGTSDHGWWWKTAWGAYPEEDVQHLWDMSPIKYVERVQSPLLVIHSERDDRCPLEQGEQMFNALRRLGKETKLIVFPEECHELSRSGTPSRRLERLNHILTWFQQHL